MWGSLRLAPINMMSVIRDIVMIGSNFSAVLHLLLIFPTVLGLRLEKNHTDVDIKKLAVCLHHVGISIAAWLSEVYTCNTMLIICMVCIDYMQG